MSAHDDAKHTTAKPAGTRPADGADAAAHAERLERVESSHAFVQHEQEGLSRELFRMAGLLERLGKRIDQLETRLNAQAANAGLGGDDVSSRGFEDERPPHAAGPMPEHD